MKNKIILIFGILLLINVCFVSSDSGLAKMQEEFQKYQQMAQNCDGCFKGEKCYDIGERKENKYCASNKKFVLLKDIYESCLEDFECKSNNCFRHHQCLYEGWDMFSESTDDDLSTLFADGTYIADNNDRFDYEQRLLNERITCDGILIDSSICIKNGEEFELEGVTYYAENYSLRKVQDKKSDNEFNQNNLFNPLTGNTIKETENNLGKSSFEKIVNWIKNIFS